MQFQAICDLGGTAGLNLYGPFLTDGPRVTFDDLRRHLDHFLDLGGEGHLALGADLDGCSVLPEGFAALNDYETLGRYLADAGYPDETIQNLFCNSLMKVVRNMLAYTGTYHGKRVSVMGSGMGIPSIGIYSYELFTHYGVERIIRIGSAGSIQKDLKLFDIVIASGASTPAEYGRFMATTIWHRLSATL